MRNGKIVPALMSVIRPTVFILGLLFGLLYFVSLFMLASAAGQFVGVFGGLGLALAAPVCWLAAVRTRARDRSTLAYVLAWCALILITLVVGAIEDGKRVQSGDHVGLFALGLVAVVYLVVLPVAALRYQQKRQVRDDAKPGPFAAPPWQ